MKNLMKKIKNLIPKLNKKKKNQPNILNKTANYIKQKYQSIKLFIDFINERTLKEYKEWQLSDDKTLPLCLIEWMFDVPLRYMTLGLLCTLSIMLNNRFIGSWIGFSIGLWLLFTVVGKITRGK